MACLVTLVSRAAEDHRDWTAVMGPEEILEIPALGLESLAPVDFLGRLGPRVRKESPYSSRITMVHGVPQVPQDPLAHLVYKVLMVQSVFLVLKDLKDTQAYQVLPVPQGQWGAVVTDIKERKETRVTWVFPDPGVVPATRR